MKTTPHLSDHLFASRPLTGAATIVITAILLLAGCASEIQWTESEKEDIDRFGSSIDYYDMATMVTTAKQAILLNDEDWETVSANFQTALFIAQQIDTTVLIKIHPELNEHYQNEFISGLSKGIYGLQARTSREKGVITRTYEGSQDSLFYGRQLLESWLDWYDINQVAITQTIGQ